jgi:hypothetical protein
MNFEHMPELSAGLRFRARADARDGHLVLYVTFKRRNWL